MLALTEPTITVTQWPREDRCDKCGETVLKARHPAAGRPVSLDPLPVLPEGPCQRCHGTGRVQGELRHISAMKGGRVLGPVPCALCQGTGRRGEPLTAEHVVMDVAGIARPYTGDRDLWEAAHRRHRCPDRP